jgi:hypothetical protein
LTSGIMFYLLDNFAQYLPPFLHQVVGSNPTNVVTPGFKEQNWAHLIHAQKKTPYIITECVQR